MPDLTPEAPEEFTAFAVVEAATGGKVVVGMSDPGPEQVGAICRYVRALPIDAPAPVDPTGRFCNADGTVKNPADTPADDPVTEAVTVAIPRRLVPEVLGWMEDEIGSWPSDTQYQRDLEAARDALRALAQENRNE